MDNLLNKIAITLDIDSQSSVEVLNVLRQVSDDIDEALAWALEVLNKSSVSIEDIMGAEIRLDYSALAADNPCADMHMCKFDANGVEVCAA